MYTFKLQSVLDHRQLIEDNIKKELADIRQQAIESQEKLERMKQKEIDTVNALKREQSQGLSSEAVVAYHGFLKELSRRITSQQQAIDAIHVQAADKKDELLEAMKKRQILEKLKDQGLARYQEEVLKKEQAFIDEIAVNQFVRAAATRKPNGEKK